MEEKPLVYIIEDDEMMADLFASYVKDFAMPKIFHDAISAIQNLDSDLPKIIFLDILLTGPDGFSFLNEIVSFENTAKIPVVIITSLDLKTANLENYNVVKILNKETLVPEDIKNIAKELLNA